MSKSHAPAVEVGAEVPEVETEHLGFKVLSNGKQGPKKVKLLPQPWPNDDLPSASANLLSVASKPGLLAAAGPNILVIASTDAVRKAFEGKTTADEIDNPDDPRLEERDIDVVSDFTPDVTISTENLRHVAFSADGDFLVVAAEQKGLISIYNVSEVVSKGRKDAEQTVQTDAPVRALLPNPAPEFEHYFAIVLDSGKLQICNVADGVKKTIRDTDVNCAAWSTRGKAVVSGSNDGTCAINMTNGELKGVIPRAPDVDESYEVTGVAWLNTDEFVAVYSVKNQDPENPEPKKLSVIKSTKNWESFTYHAFAWDPLPEAFEPPRRALPARFSSIRLRNWKPDLDDMLIITSSHADSIAILASTSNKISPDQQNLKELMLVNVDDTKKAAVPRTAYGEDELDSVFIGEALDLSSKEKILRPIPSLEEINEAPWPLPAYMALTHEGLLTAWWVVWNRSIEAGERYPGLIFKSESTQREPTSTPRAHTPASKLPIATSTPYGQPSTPSSHPPFGRSATTPGTPGIPHFGNAGHNSPSPALMRPTPPGFGTPGFGTSSPSSLPTPTLSKPPPPAFGAPAAIGAGAKTAFGTPSAIGASGGSGFGAVGNMGNKSSLWGAPAQNSDTKANPFSATAGSSSGFAKFGQNGGTSSFSSFGSTGSAQAGSGFAALGQQKSGFANLKSEPSFGSTGSAQAGSGFAALGQQKSGFANLKSEPSFGSTVTIGSGTGSSLPSWSNTPSQQSNSIFGQQNKSSFNTASFESKTSDMSDSNGTQGRKRDEATPTPQAPASQGLFGLAGGFKLGTTFTPDGTAKDDPAKPAAPANGSFFGSDFANTLGGTGIKPPATPATQPPQYVSTTPASPPKQKLFPSDTPAKESATPKAAPPVQEPATPIDDAPLPPDFTKSKPSKIEDAPLPPDFINTKLPQSNGDDLPPLAGSPGVEVEAPSSSVEASPIDKEGVDEDDYSEDDDDDDEEPDDTYPPNNASKSFQPKLGNQSSFFPPAPTPPAVKSEGTSQSGRSASPAQHSLFGQPSKPGGNQPSFGATSLFGQQPAKGPFGSRPNSSASAKPTFLPPTNQAQNLRSPSPMRSSSSSRIQREPLVAPGASLSSSIQGSKPPTPQPQFADLEDEEDEKMRAQLAQPIEPSRNLEEFIAYQNYSGGKSPNKTGHAAQIEMIYKDINGMVDALGWNMRSIKSFTQYHQKPQPNHRVDRGMLEDILSQGQDGPWFEQFALCEIQALKLLEDDLEQELEAGRVENVLDKLAQLARLLHEKAKLMTRLNDIRRQIINRKDPERVEALRKAPLPKELADSQKSLRNDYAQLLTSLRKAEDAVAVLRSRVATHNAQSGSTKAVPSMDAVKKTILRLANLAEQKNNDILVLEAQMRKMGLAEPSRRSSTSSRNAGTPRQSRGTSLRHSIADTPYATPPTGHKKLTLAELNRRALTPEVENTPTPSKGYGLFYTPEGSPTAGGKDIARLSDLVDENMDVLRETARKRKQVAKDLRSVLLDRGVKATKVN